MTSDKLKRANYLSEEIEQTDRIMRNCLLYNTIAIRDVSLSLSHPLGDRLFKEIKKYYAEITTEFNNM